MSSPISQIKALEILDSRGNPTIEAQVILDSGVSARAAVPSGASTGIHEAIELRDGDQSRYGGLGVQQAVTNIQELIAPALKGLDPQNQAEIDQVMIDLDGTPNKKKLGANAILAVSMAVTRSAALSAQIPLYQQVAKLINQPTDKYLMPIPLMNLLNGGKHAAGSSDFQEYMIAPVGAPSLTEAVRWGAEVFHTLGKLLVARGFTTQVGDEGGYAPALGNNEEPLKIMIQAIEKAGYQPGKDIYLAMDVAASSFFKDGSYVLETENLTLSSTQLVDRYQDWLSKYPLVMIEDGLAEDDWPGFADLNQRLGDKIQVVGDDLFVTNVERLNRGIQEKVANSILVKLNQIGTVTETIKAIQLARKNKMTAIVSHRSGETADTFISDFVVGTGTGLIKTGSLSRSERVEKYNQLMRIEQELDGQGALIR